ncbi:putative eukaryotic peptide chain release factor GTP-binding subunit ERF3A [Apostichopus japonicus]|uniref:Putative eukaryotic peptide chain release factor GTP-binding subunit ERF3A n=1 Tax=Stichopus japonicus TaxID=307972 RepID=A0A2G8LAZ8_STIJA|nr:putative eukaryotic peptide chain release factor GTP-binding subunit ERF3A [Apostichopus japonicus]
MEEQLMDSWDQQDDPGPGDAAENSSMSSQFSNLNVNAKPFIPNVHAPEFVPSFTPKPAEADNSTVEEAEVETETPAETTADTTGPEMTETVEDEEEGEEEEEKEEEEDISTPSPDEELSTDNEVEPIKPTASPSPPTPKKKEPVQEEIKSKKEPVNVVFIGHVDAGKSTIGGHIMYLTGQVDKRTLEKYEREAKEKNRESWYLSWALDTNQEERDKGKTVEVISARKGEFETGFERGGQTREHTMLAKTAGVKHLVVLVNKMDDQTVNWSEERFEECKEKLLPFMRKVGFHTKKDLHFIPVSGITGANLKVPFTECPWYKGPPFIQFIDDLPSLRRNSDGPLRMPVMDKFKDMGTILLGKLESGKIEKGANLIIMPNKTLRSRRENVKLKVRGIEEEDVLPGFVVCEPTNLCHTCKVFDAQIVILEHKSIICPGYSAVLHIHNAVEEVQIQTFIGLIDKKTGKRSKGHPRFIKQDQIAIARLEAQELFCLESFNDFRKMGRFTLRDEGKTIAIGKVLKLL